jgi:hypothetical protein
MISSGESCSLDFITSPHARLKYGSLGLTVMISPNLGTSTANPKELKIPATAEGAGNSPNPYFVKAVGMPTGGVHELLRSC